MLRVHVGFVAACLTAAAFMFVGAHATAQQQFAASTNRANAEIQVAQTMDETAFKKYLVDHSPWNVTWRNYNGREGYHKLRFILKGEGLSGEYFGSNTGPQVNPLTKLKLKSEKGACISFNIQGRTGNRDYLYCLEADRTMSGKYQGWSDSGGSSYEGTATAKPAGK